MVSENHTESVEQCDERLDWWWEDEIIIMGSDDRAI